MDDHGRAAREQWLRVVAAGLARRINQHPEAFRQSAERLRDGPVSTILITGDKDDPRAKITDQFGGYWTEDEDEIAGRMGPVFRRLRSGWEAINDRFQERIGGDRFYSMRLEDCRRIVLLTALTFNPDFDGAGVGLGWAWESQDRTDRLENRHWAWAAHPTDDFTLELVTAAIHKLNEEGPSWWTRLDLPGRLAPAVPPAQPTTSPGLPLPRGDAQGNMIVPGGITTAQSIRWVAESARRFTAFVRKFSIPTADGGYQLSSAQGAHDLYMAMVMFASGVTRHFLPMVSQEELDKAGGVKLYELKIGNGGMPADLHAATSAIVFGWVPKADEPMPRRLVPGAVVAKLDQAAEYLERIAWEFDEAAPTPAVSFLPPTGAPVHPVANDSDTPPADAAPPVSGLAKPTSRSPKARSTLATVVVEPKSWTKRVTLAYAAETWFDMSKPTLKLAIANGRFAARQVTANYWVFDLDEVDAVNPNNTRDADPASSPEDESPK